MANKSAVKSNSINDGKKKNSNPNLSSVTTEHNLSTKHKVPYTHGLVVINLLLIIEKQFTTIFSISP